MIGILTTRLHEIRVFSNERLLNDTPFSFLFLEVRIGEEEEHAFELSFREEVADVLHSIGSEATDILPISFFVVT
jgi:hypothetical protein